MSACEIVRVTYRDPGPGRIPHLRVDGRVVDGPRAGEPVSGTLSLSPRSAFRLKRWFDNLGWAGAERGFEDVEHEPEMVEPDMRGRRLVIDGDALPEPFGRD